MKKIILSLAFFTLSLFTFGQEDHGNEAPPTIESYGEGAGTSGDQSIYFGFKAGQEDTGTENIFLGYGAGRSNKGKYNVFLGNSAGFDNQGINNIFIGYNSGLVNTQGSNNSFLGYYSGLNNKDGNSNTFLGAYSGQYNKGGESNTFLGTYSGKNNISGLENTFVGDSAGTKNQYGNGNTYIGFNAGAHNEKDGNVFIGYKAGLNETSSSKLYIANTDTTNPLIYGDFSAKHLAFNGDVSIGTYLTTDDGVTYALSVAGKVRAQEVKVYTDWADYVFEDNYDLPTLSEVEAHIEEHGHLQDIPSAETVEDNGIELGEMNKLLLQKIEELTLYTIEQEKRLKALEAKLNQQ